MKRIQSSILLLLLFFSLSSCRTPDAPTNLLPPRSFADNNSKFIKIDGIDFHYKQAGDGDIDILMMHGLLGNIYGWEQISPELSSKYRLSSYDRPAFGLTERPEVTEDHNPYSPEQAELQTMELISKLELNKPVLLGHSAGGNLALRLAINHPDSFSGLILISPGVYTEIPPKIIRKLMGLCLFKKIGINAIRSIPEKIDDHLSEIFFDPDVVTPSMREGYLRPTRTENWDWALWEYFRAQDDSMLAGNLSEITLPVLIIQGSNDEVVPPKDNIRAADIIPNADLLFIKNCGHVAHEEKPQAVVNAVIDFINRL